MQTEQENGLTQPLPAQLQESIWKFVREKIASYEKRIGSKVGKYEIHFTDAGRIEIEVIFTESQMDAEIDDGLEGAGLKGEVNRMESRVRLADDLERGSDDTLPS